MLKYGFEMEYFVFDQKTGSHVLCPDALPKDECGYLAEARGEPHADPVSAAYLLLAEEKRLCTKAEKLGLWLDRTLPTLKLDRKLARDALRRHGKPGYSDQRHNMYGKDYPVNNPWNRAALHVHFSDTEEFTWTNKEGLKLSKTIHHPLDMCKYILALDKAFAKEIKTARRLPGFYEMKPHGFEYRSLPCNVDPAAVAQVILEVK